MRTYAMPDRVFVASSLAVIALAFGGNAAAQEACGDTTCPKGWSCEMVSVPCPDIGCDGPDCPVCEPTTEGMCRPEPCTSDADCDPAMRCVTEERSVCTGGSAPCEKPDGGEPECPEPEPEDCVLETVSACMPRYFGACESASDCGEGFTCEPEEVCSCGGSAGSAGSGGALPEDAPDAGDAFVPSDGGADPVPPDDCDCQPTDTNHCVAIQAACTEETAVTDCPSGWSCEDNPEGVCFSGPDGSGCTPADPPKLCMPPFYDLGGGGRGVDDGESTGGGVPVGTDAGTEPPTSGGPSRGNAAEEDGAMSSESGGCSVSGATGASSGALLGLVLAAFGLTMARRRR